MSPSTKPISAPAGKRSCGHILRDKAYFDLICRKGNLQACLPQQNPFWHLQQREAVAVFWSDNLFRHCREGNLRLCLNKHVCLNRTRFGTCRKEKLWPHVREFADRGIAHAKKMVTTLAEAKTPCELYMIHGHYADAGEVAALISSTLDVDMCMTGHSLGRNKLEHLLASGTVSKAEIESTYKISRRVEAEERALESAIMVFTSTKQEIDEQWGLYDG